MSISELAMLVNDNFDKPLNQQIRDMQYIGSYLFTSSTTFTPDKSGYYKVIVVGGGGDSAVDKYATRIGQGGSGAVAISTLLLDKSKTHTITVTDSKSSFDSIEATSGETAEVTVGGKGGVATGGQFNYNGLDGNAPITGGYADGLGVGVFIPSLMKNYERTQVTSDSYEHHLRTGYGILGFGVSRGVSSSSSGNNIVSIPATGGCVLIIPLELTE